MKIERFTFVSLVGKMMAVLMISIYSYIWRKIKKRIKNLGIALRYRT